MHRLKSLEPFTRHFSGQQIFDMLDVGDIDSDQDTPSIFGEYIMSITLGFYFTNHLNYFFYSPATVQPDSVDVLAPILAKYKIAQETNKILYINFTSVVDYMWLLRAACECLAAFEKRALLYLAAAVSDFYIPSDMMPTHKMQSGHGAPTISLQLVPKMLAPLVSLWVPNAFVVSFKLETDENLLIVKSRDSLNKYKHKVGYGCITFAHRVCFANQ